MIYRIPASKDTFITNKLVNGRRVSASNAGASEILQLYKMSTSPQSGTKANILINFSTGSALTAFSASNYSGSISWVLTMKNVETANPNIGSFDAEIIANAVDWDEGKGHDLDCWTDKGYANWDYSKNGIPWAVTGAKSGAPVASVHFETGHEDLEADVTYAVNSVSVPYGFHVSITSTQEQDNNDYYMKAFRSRQTHFPQYQPYLEARWNDFTGSYSSAFVDILDSTSSLVGGIYNLKSVYRREEYTTLKVYLRPKDWNLSVVTTASADASGTILTNAYYRVVDNTSDEVQIPFGTGTVPYTKLSYNDSGNYFKFYMQNLVPGLVYRFDIGYFDIEGDWHIFNDEMTFRVI